MSTQIVGIDRIVDAPGRNPNVMAPERFRLLVEQIRTRGFLQPMLVRPVDHPSGPKLEVVDGSHRFVAAKELGLTQVSVVVANLDDAAARKARIAMNRLRGEVDLGAVAITLTELIDLGEPLDTLSLTGFSDDEIRDLLHATNHSDPTDGGRSGLDKPVDLLPAEPKPVKPFVLELRFETKADLARAKKGLKKAAGEGDHAAGLLALIEGASPRKVRKPRKEAEEGD